MGCTCSAVGDMPELTSSGFDYDKRLAGTAGGFGSLHKNMRFLDAFKEGANHPCTLCHRQPDI